jgi:dolichyl-phosphate beta-glucosyltransferase
VSAPYLSIVVPSYNEEKRLLPTLTSILAYIDARGIPAELIVVDDGSVDRMADLVEAARRDEPRIRLIRFPVNRGKGAAVREGALAASGSLVLISDADLSTPIEEFDRLLARMRETSSDVVIGSRGLPASNIEVPQPFFRVLMGKVFNLLIRAVTGLEFRDTQCGFKLVDREKTAPIFRKMVVDRFAFDVELLALARLAGLRILEEPVTWRNSADSRVTPIRSSWNMLLDVLRLRRRIRRGFYREREKAAQA